MKLQYLNDFDLFKGQKQPSPGGLWIELHWMEEETSPSGGIKPKVWGFKSMRITWITAHFALGEKGYVYSWDTWLKLSRFIFFIYFYKVVWKIVDLKNDPNKLIILPNKNSEIIIKILMVAITTLSIKKN